MPLPPAKWGLNLEVVFYPNGGMNCKIAINPYNVEGVDCAPSVFRFTIKSTQHLSRSRSDFFTVGL